MLPLVGLVTGVCAGETAEEYEGRALAVATLSSSSSAHRQRVIALQFHRLARDFVARSVVARFLRRRRWRAERERAAVVTSQAEGIGGSSGGGAFAARLPCCEAYCRLEAEVEQTAKRLSDGSEHMRSCAIARAEELQQLSAERASLRCLEARLWARCASASEPAASTPILASEYVDGQVPRGFGTSSTSSVGVVSQEVLALGSCKLVMLKARVRSLQSEIDGLQLKAQQARQRVEESRAQCQWMSETHRSELDRIHTGFCSFSADDNPHSDRKNPELHNGCLELCAVANQALLGTASHGGSAERSGSSEVADFLSQILFLIGRMP
eukprot:CAMPEP_0177479920 /NCGR_PEP_ID=MMETSP0369-20130122/25523_1 /TAXON_ID=447022 ORGANISM="Scrippsiella hangoei-like, Strain SHHI-4" /NCGR_SAMPLE_ID=MMETSP0369 /ASSEMBLY_ACC=CAM_ASM_000364 /LENGTH=325 /DNA_ID=CAMNT_0018955541 /DNA_START=25 /DNA_END=999 /DNA_ORIENTATION=-